VIGRLVRSGRRVVRLAVGAAFGTAVALAPVGPAVVAAFASAGATSCPAPAPGVHRYAPDAPGGGRSVALTFDDGPGPDTATILRILSSAGVTATFFNVGVHEAADPAAVRAERAAGMALGDHTWDHVTLAGTSAGVQRGEIATERRAEVLITGAAPCLFRPPGGSADATTLALAGQYRLAVWDWSVDTEDWKAHGSADPYWVDRIRSRAEDGVGLDHPVVLMHDQIGGNPATVAALPDVIAFYRERGYRFVDLFGHERMAGAAPGRGARLAVVPNTPPVRTVPPSWAVLPGTPTATPLDGVVLG
jgi:peptidoglycan/xylan/chitin deacetylase (PgdA/CDA1 family)